MINPYERQPLDSLFIMRRRLLRGMVIALSVLGLPALVSACIEAARLGQVVGMLLYIVLYLVVSSTTLFFHRLPFGFSTIVMLGCLYLISLFNLVHFSFAGAGIILFLAISLLATVLLGIRSGWAVFGVCLISLMGIGFCFVHGLFPVTPGMPDTTHQMISWLTAAAVFTLLSGTLIISTGMLQGHLIRLVGMVQRQAEELKHANKELSEEIKRRITIEDKLKQSELQFRTLFEVAPDAIYLTDRDG